jgi:hypothetical protein
MKLNDKGFGFCSVPMWSCGCPAGFCNDISYGERPEGREFRDNTGRLRRLDGRYDGYVPGLACPGHGGPEPNVFMDGDMFCATTLNFVNLQESIAGFGKTKIEAIAELEKQLKENT